MVPIKESLVPASMYGTKCPYSMIPMYITTHNTANDAPAANEIAYMKSNNQEVSFHYAVDDKEIIRGIPENRNAWHAGDGNGDGNRKSIGVEICYSLSGGSKFTQAEKNAAEFIASLLKERGWGIGRLKKHQDWSGKYCPHKTLDNGWQRFVDMVSSYMNDNTNSITQDGNTLYRVQVGAFSKADNATKLRAELASAGYDTLIVYADDGLYKVQVGAYAVKSNATNMESKLKKAGYATYITTKSGKATNGSTATITAKKGDKVMVKSGAKTYTGGSLDSHVYSTVYDVIEVNGDRAVIGIGTKVTAAIKVTDLLVQ